MRRSRIVKAEDDILRTASQCRHYAMCKIDYLGTGLAERDEMRRAMVEIEPWLDGLAKRTKGLTFLKYVFSQGCSRKENFLYR